MSATAPPSTTPRRKVVRAIGPRLRKLLTVIWVLLAILIANSAYLATITFLEWLRGETFQNYFYQLMFLGHLVLGLLFLLPFLVFAIVHMRNTWNRRNRRAVVVGYVLFAVSLVLLGTGLLLFRVGGFELRQPQVRSIVYWLHVGSPLAAVWLYVLHRLAGPRLKWRAGLAYAGAVAVTVVGMASLHTQDPRAWNRVGPEEGTKYFKPSLARTTTGDFIPADVLMMDDYCKKCHPDVHAGWEKSVHRFSSFNNPPYLASVRETRQVSMKRHGDVHAARWCAGCHDPVPFFSGAFDDPNFDDIAHPTAHAGITCTVCHAITHVNSNKGNADYTIEQPAHYPFARSDNAVLQWINNQLIKAKPEFHKKTFLKDFHSSAEFCSTCHKVHIPEAVTGYREFLRGQNHYDSWLLSGVSGHGARSFYYPETAQQNCNGCHMPLQESDDFGAKLFDDRGKLTVHDHLFASANTGIAWMKDLPEVVDRHREILEDSMRVDIFGIREEGSIEGELHAPLRPELPTLEPGQKYLVETVIRTLKLGHHFTQGTSDSNEVWLDVTVTSGGEVIGRSGGLDEDRTVDPWSHFVNTFMLDEEGNRINRRNPQDIRTPLYSHQMPPGAGQVAHYELQLPESLDDHVTIEVKLQYRKFDTEYLQIVADSFGPRDTPLRGQKPGEPYRNPLPIVTMASDRVTLPVAGVDKPIEDQSRDDIPEWQRWNDYGIGLFLEGKAELRQAEAAFAEVETLGRYDGPLNQARVFFVEGRLDDAVDAIKRAVDYDDPAPPPWTVNWLSGAVNRQQGRLDEAEENLRAVVDGRTAEQISRGFDFSRDYVVLNELGGVLFDKARRERGEARKEQRDALLRDAAATFERVLAIDSENVTAHYNMYLIMQQLGETDEAEKHRELHQRYKPDDNIRGKAIRLARERYPAAAHAAEPVTIYSLHRPEAPGLEANAAGSE
ncbi:multiheme c-type cytochrome [Maioricimonas rarisocia]|uniref:multiheme c-type cytochrome n=1 Tax=Maioricimonas rarisocia TaxID=2528026 RepID=UPI001E294C6E|nr:multiheme c-type cytochrome [Maioricimonas rarisocia]